MRKHRWLAPRRTKGVLGGQAGFLGEVSLGLGAMKRKSFWQRGRRRKDGDDGVVRQTGGVGRERERGGGGGGGGGGGRGNIPYNPTPNHTPLTNIFSSPHLPSTNLSDSNFNAIAADRATPSPGPAVQSAGTECRTVQSGGSNRRQCRPIRAHPLQI